MNILLCTEASHASDWPIDTKPVVETRFSGARRVHGAVDRGLCPASGRLDEPAQQVIEQPRRAPQEGVAEMPCDARADNPGMQAVRSHVVDVALLPTNAHTN